VGAGAAELHLGGVEVEITPQEGPDLANRHPGVEHEPDNGGVAQGVEATLGEGEEAFDLFVLQERYLLVQRLVHGLYGVQI
jgi:hypothetical protein